MPVIGIVCEYNPLHSGHEKQFRLIKEHFGANAVIVCAMSGNFVQRGEPAIFDKSLRAKAAIDCGADLVIELPVTVSLNSAEGFAAGGVAVLSPLCDYLCFGTESETANALMDGAKVLLSSDFPPILKKHLQSGVSFPKARALALAEMGINLDVGSPNNILGLEYCKAILSQGSSMKPFAVHREGSYHDEALDGDNPSATAVRKAIREHKEFESYLPQKAREAFQNATIHLPESGEKAILYRLCTMTDEEFEALPFGSEGLWRKLMHAAREKCSLPEIMEAVKSKRYTYTRIARMVMCAYLGITREMMEAPVPYCRILGFTDAGRQALSVVRKAGCYRNIGEKTGDYYEQLECRAERLYPLFTNEKTEFKKLVYYPENPKIKVRNPEN